MSDLFWLSEVQMRRLAPYFPLAYSIASSPEWRARRGDPDQVMIDVTHLKAHRTAASLFKRGQFPDVSGAPRVA